MPAKKTAPQPAMPEEQFHAISRALADPRRFAILEQIAATSVLPCTALKAHKDISPATISHHLRELTEAGLLEAEREGRTMKLSLRRPIWNAYRKRLSNL